MPNKIVVFESKKIRRIWHNEEWYFSVADVCGALTDSPDAGAYWRKLKQRLNEEGSEVVTFCHGLKLEAPDGQMRETDCANTKGMFRIIQSIPSPKAEPFKLWLAQVGYDRVQEIENPELAQERMKELYELKGYPKDWIHFVSAARAENLDMTVTRQLSDDGYIASFHLYSSNNFFLFFSCSQSLFRLSRSAFP